MIITGGKYWAVAGSGAPTATSASAAANRTAFAFIEAVLVCDLPVAPRDLPMREHAEKIPSGAALPNSPIRGARCASERRLASLDRSETISARRPEGPFEALSYHILRKKGNSPIAARKMKTTRISRVTAPAAVNKPTTGRTSSRPGGFPAVSHNNACGVADEMRRSRATPEPGGDYFPPVLASASLQPSLRSAACDLMHCAVALLPGLSPQNFVASALQALRTAAVRMIAT
jgi:hypothetical protein